MNRKSPQALHTSQDICRAEFMVAVAHGSPSRPSSSGNRPVKEVRSARSANSLDPACDTTTAPSVVTVIGGRVLVGSTSKVPSGSVTDGVATSSLPCSEGTFVYQHPAT